MAVIRVEKNSNYTTMSNTHLRDKRISLKAKGLLSQMLSLPDDWGYSIAGLASINKEGEKSIISTLSELKDAQYVKIRKLNPNETKSGRYEYEYVVYEVPDQKQDPQNRALETRCLKQGACIQGVENKVLETGAYINNLKQNTKKQKTERRNTERDRRFSPPTFEEVKAYCEERNNSVDAQHFIDYYTSKGWTVGNSPMKDWKAAVRTWERNGVNKNERGRADTDRGVTSPSHRTANGGNYV